LDGYRGLPLAEVISILRIGREIGELETADGGPLTVHADIRLTTNGVDRAQRTKRLRDLEQKHLRAAEL